MRALGPAVIQTLSSFIEVFMLKLTVNNKVLCYTSCIICLLYCLPALSTAGGQIHGAKSAAMGTAFTAVADDPSAITNNPAGIVTLKGKNIYGGVTAIIPFTEYTNPSGESEDTKDQVFFPPHLYMTSDFGFDNLGFGLGIFSPLGIGGTKWDNQGLTRYASTESLLSTIAVSPAIGWRIFPWLSIGAAVRHTFSSITEEKKISQAAFGASDASLKIDGNGRGWGYGMGFLFFPDEKLSFGVNYASGSNIDQDLNLSLEDIAPAIQAFIGDKNFETDASGTFSSPPCVSFGVAYRPNNSWTFTCDIEWIGWSTYDKMYLDLYREVPIAGLTDSILHFDFRDTWSYKIGMDYKIFEAFSLRTGYNYSQNPVPEFRLGPGNPDSNQHKISIGFGFRHGKLVLDVFYVAVIYENRTVHNEILSGEYEGYAHMSGISFGYAF